MRALLIFVLLGLAGCVTPNFKPLCRTACKDHKGLKHLMACGDEQEAACECKDGSLQKAELPKPPPDSWHGHPDHDIGHLGADADGDAD